MMVSFPSYGDADDGGDGNDDDDKDGGGDGDVMVMMVVVMNPSKGSFEGHVFPSWVLAV